MSIAVAAPFSSRFTSPRDDLSQRLAVGWIVGAHLGVNRIFIVHRDAGLLLA